MWNGVKIVHGRARHPQSQGSVERCNQDIKQLIGIVNVK
jgi:transposase InsO family protein